MRKIRGWVIPDEDARSILRQIEERISSSEIDVEHRDMLIRLRSLIEDDFAEAPLHRDQPLTVAHKPGS
jgi:hypothetical protein